MSLSLSSQFAFRTLAANEQLIAVGYRLVVEGCAVIADAGMDASSQVLIDQITRPRKPVYISLIDGLAAYFQHRDVEGSASPIKYDDVAAIPGSLQMRKQGGRRFLDDSVNPYARK